MQMVREELAGYRESPERGNGKGKDKEKKEEKENGKREKKKRKWKKNYLGIAF